jgi:hypothetical protein
MTRSRKPTFMGSREPLRSSRLDPPRRRPLAARASLQAAVAGGKREAKKNGPALPGRGRGHHEENLIAPRRTERQSRHQIHIKSQVNIP